MKKKVLPRYVFFSPQMITLSIGIFLITLFFVIFIILSVFFKRVDFYTLFYRNISNNIFLTILSGFHVSTLASGILIIIIAFFNITPNIYFYDNRFIISMYLQKNIVINLDKIEKCYAKIFYRTEENLFRKYPKKECRVYFENPYYSFYLAYPVEGYFDDIEIFLKDDKKDLTMRGLADKKEITDIFKYIKTLNSINFPYLPDQKK